MKVQGAGMNQVGLPVRVLFLCVSCTVVAALTFIYGWDVSRLLIAEDRSNWWFDADVPQTFAAMADRLDGRHYRASIHPLFPWLTTAPIHLLKLAGVSPAFSVRVLTSGIAATWVFLFHMTAECLIGRTYLALATTLLALSSSSALFWLWIPETWPLGSISILVCVALAAVGRTRQVSREAHLWAGVLALGITVTNWSAAILLAVRAFRSRLAIAVMLQSFAIVSVISIASPLAFPDAGALLRPDRVQEAGFLTHQSVTDYSRHFLVEAVVAPTAGLGEIQGWTHLSLQDGRAVVWTPASLVGAILWGLLLAYAGVVVLPLSLIDPACFVLVLALSAQFALHLFYGKETFLYSLQFAPLLILMVGCAMSHARSRVWAPVLVLSAAVIAFSNWLRLLEAIARTHVL